MSSSQQISKVRSFVRYAIVSKVSQGSKLHSVVPGICSSSKSWLVYNSSDLWVRLMKILKDSLLENEMERLKELERDTEVMIGRIIKRR